MHYSIAGLLMLLFVVSSYGQTAPRTAPIDVAKTVIAERASSRVLLSPADRAWNLVRGFGQFDSPPMGKSSADTRPSMLARPETYLEQANQLRAFYRQFPTHAAVDDARRLEALCLGWVALHGDTSQETRRRALVDQVRANRAFAPRLKYEIVAQDQQVAIGKRRFENHAAYLGAREKSARSLITQYPSIGGGYELLLAVAKESGPVRGKVIAEEVIRRSQSGETKHDARQLSDRYALVGQPLTTVMARGGVFALPPESSGRVSIVYSWSRTDAASLRTAKEIEMTVPHAFRLGVNLDKDTSDARQVATREGFSGSQHYDSNGKDGVLATAMKMNQTGFVYLVDRAGIIRDVLGHEQIREKLAQFGP